MRDGDDTSVAEIEDTRVETYEPVCRASCSHVLPDDSMQRPQLALQDRLQRDVSDQAESEVGMPHLVSEESNGHRNDQPVHYVYTFARVSL